MFVQQYILVPFIDEEKEKKILTQGKKRQTGDREQYAKIQQQQLISGYFIHDILSSLSSSSHLFSLGHPYRFTSEKRKRDRQREEREWRERAIECSFVVAFMT
jgi:hypothetical protein